MKVNPINVVKLLLPTFEAMQISETRVNKAEIELAESFEKILISAMDEVNAIETVEDETLDFQESFKVDGEVISSIGKGLCVLIGIKRDDTLHDMEYIVKKILNTKIFDGENGKKWTESVMDKQYEVLCISQFTLYHIMKGNRLDFHNAMCAHEAELFYNKLLAQLAEDYKPDKIKEGKFGAMMEVDIQNSGPVTLEIESPVLVD